MASFITHRKHFGEAYRGLQSGYFARMPQKSGVFVSMNVPTDGIETGATNPGDIDLIVVPYENDDLILDRVLACEVKVVRANYLNQGKSPNDLGFSQATGLSKIGFPYVALAHLIVSDSSPEHAWKSAMVARIVDEDLRVEFVDPMRMDLMPADLIDRSFGRLKKIGSKSPVIGLIAAYIGNTDQDVAGPNRPSSFWMPMCRQAKFNPHFRKKLVKNVALLVERFPNTFFDVPRFDP